MMVLFVLFAYMLFLSGLLHSFFLFSSFFLTTNCMPLFLLLFQRSYIFGILTTFILVYILHSTSAHIRALYVFFFFSRRKMVHMWGEKSSWHVFLGTIEFLKCARVCFFSQTNCKFVFWQQLNSWLILGDYYLNRLSGTISILSSVSASASATNYKSEHIYSNWRNCSEFGVRRIFFVSGIFLFAILILGKK